MSKIIVTTKEIVKYRSDCVFVYTQILSNKKLKKLLAPGIGTATEPGYVRWIKYRYGDTRFFINKRVEEIYKGYAAGKKPFNLSENDIIHILIRGKVFQQVNLPHKKAIDEQYPDFHKVLFKTYRCYEMFCTMAETCFVSSYRKSFLGFRNVWLHYIERMYEKKDFDREKSVGDVERARKLIAKSYHLSMLSINRTGIKGYMIEHKFISKWEWENGIYNNQVV